MNIFNKNLASESNKRKTVKSISNLKIPETTSSITPNDFVFSEKIGINY
jgi:hypothetical protein